MNWITWLPCGCDSRPLGVKVKASSPCVRMTINRVKREEKAVSRSSADDPAKQSCIWIGNEPMSEPSSCLNRLSRADEPAQKGNGWRAGLGPSLSRTPSYPSRRTVGSCVQRQTETRNEVTPVELSGKVPEQVVSRMLCRGKDCLRSKCPRESRGIRRRRYSFVADRVISRS
jgi:hypothetical protein